MSLLVTFSRNDEDRGFASTAVTSIMAAHGASRVSSLTVNGPAELSEREREALRVLFGEAVESELR